MISFEFDDILGQRVWGLDEVGCLIKILLLLGVGFEPTHSKVIGLKPIALDRSANPTNLNKA